MIAILLSHLNLLAHTAYEKFSADFKGALLGSSSDLQPGAQWSCTSSLHGADKNFRFVQVWHYLFQFSDDSQSGGLANLAPRGQEFSTFLATGEGWVSQSAINPGDSLTLKVTEYGHLIYWVYRAEDPNRSRYGICENPLSHNDNDWEANGPVWSYNHGGPEQLPFDPEKALESGE